MATAGVDPSAVGTVGVAETQGELCLGLQGGVIERCTDLVRSACGPGRTCVTLNTAAGQGRFRVNGRSSHVLSPFLPGLWVRCPLPTTCCLLFGGGLGLLPFQVHQKGWSPQWSMGSRPSCCFGEGSILLQQRSPGRACRSELLFRFSRARPGGGAVTQPETDPAWPGV